MAALRVHPLRPFPAWGRRRGDRRDEKGRADRRRLALSSVPQELGAVPREAARPSSAAAGIKQNGRSVTRSLLLFPPHVVSQAAPLPGRPADRGPPGTRGPASGPQNGSPPRPPAPSAAGPPLLPRGQRPLCGAQSSLPSGDRGPGAPPFPSPQEGPKGEGRGRPRRAAPPPRDAEGRPHRPRADPRTPPPLRSADVPSGRPRTRSTARARRASRLHPPPRALLTPNPRTRGAARLPPRNPGRPRRPFFLPRVPTRDLPRGELHLGEGGARRGRRRPSARSAPRPAGTVAARPAAPRRRWRRPALPRRLAARRADGAPRP